MRILVTAIGSMSAECVIRSLKKTNHYIFGCDIYPKDWHYETRLCDAFAKAPYSTNEIEYIGFLLEICRKNDINFIVPLTDLEIDIINRNRSNFEKEGIILCMQKDTVLKIVRNKYNLFCRFENDANVPSIKTFLLSEFTNEFPFPCIVKPINGRSSEGLIKNATLTQIATIKEKSKFIVQEQLTGDIFTIDVCRNAESRDCIVIPRQELLRTKNGAGLTVRICDEKNLTELVRYICDELDINGCINMEFILCDGNYYLIDINPRFSAGVAFSSIAGYDMPNNHLNCFLGKRIAPQPTINEMILIKKYQEVQ